MTLLIPNEIEPLTPADAVEVQQNYGVIEQYINTNVVNRNGSVAMTAPLTLYGQPSQDQHAATKAYVDSILPIGVIMPYGGTTAPAGRWALCNGASVSKATYPELHAVIGYRFGGSGGSFTLPDLKGRVIVGVDATQTRFDVTGDKGGSWVVPVPQHNHVMTHNHPSFVSGGQSVNHTHEHPHTHSIGAHTHTFSDTATTASGGAHTHAARVRNNMPSSPSGTAVSAVLNGGDPNYNGTGIVNNGNAADGAHTHSVTVSGTTSASASGNTGAVSEATTGAASVGHTHTVDVPNFTGNTANAGTANAEHLPPYLVLNYIIRVS